MKHLQGGAGMVSSLVQSDGMAALALDVTRVEPGDGVRFLPFKEVR